MNRVELHPEALLERARQHVASPEDLKKLAAHLATCKACAFEHAVAAASDRANATLPDDDVVLARVRDGALRVLAARAQRPRIRRLSGRFVTIAAAAVVLLVATAAIGARLVQYLRARSSEPAVAHRNDVVATSANSIVEPAPAPRASATAEPQPIVIEKPTQSAPRSSRVFSPPAASAEPSTSAADLFARANLARRKGEPQEAAHLYRELQRAFPGSSEEFVSRVSLGRILLDRLGDAGGALVQFDSYLANPSHRNLRQEALIGRGLALGRLGRRNEERAAWNALLAAYPASAYSDRARARLVELQ